MSSHPGLSGGSIAAQKMNRAVNTELLQEILCWKESGVRHGDIIDCLRQRTVAPQYTPQSWKAGAYGFTGRPCTPSILI